MANDYTRGGPGDPTVKAIERAVAYFFGMRVDDLHHRGTTRAVTVPRQIAMYLMKQMTEASVGEIGRYFGSKCSSNVGRSIAKLETQRCKKGVVDLVICELLQHTELRLTRERKRLDEVHRRPM
jgi:chromosomal replication initiator protein